MLADIIILIVVILTVALSAAFVLYSRRKNGYIRKQDLKDVGSITIVGIIIEVIIYVTVKFVLKC